MYECIYIRLYSILRNYLCNFIIHFWSRSPSGLRHELSSLARTPGLWVRIPLRTRMFSCVYVFLCLCTGRGLATSWSPIQGVLPTALDLVTEVKRKFHGGGQGLNWAVEPNKTNFLGLSQQANYTDWAYRCLSAKLVPTFSDIGCRVIRATEPQGRILVFLDRSRYYFFQAALQLYSRGLVDPVPDPLFLRKSLSSGNRTQDLWICSQELWPLDHRGDPVEPKEKNVIIQQIISSY
jgi:hypothetical protein